MSEDGVFNGSRLLHSLLMHGRESVTRYHFQQNTVGVTIRHHACQRAAPCHAVSAGVIDDDHVGAALLDKFGGETNALAEVERSVERKVHPG